MVALEEHPGGVLIPVRVRAAARRNGVSGEHDGALRIEVTSTPEKGKANKAVAEVLAGVFSVAKSAVKLVSGSTSSQKRFLLTGLSLAEAQRRLSEVLEP